LIRRSRGSQRTSELDAARAANRDLIARLNHAIRRA
jgi:hypothetical protein